MCDSYFFIFISLYNFRLTLAKLELNIKTCKNILLLFVVQNEKQQNNWFETKSNNFSNEKQQVQNKKQQVLERKATKSGGEKRNRRLFLARIAKLRKNAKTGGKTPFSVPKDKKST